MFQQLMTFWRASWCLLKALAQRECTEESVLRVVQALFKLLEDQRDRVGDAADSQQQGRSGWWGLLVVLAPIWRLLRQVWTGSGTGSREERTAARERVGRCGVMDSLNALWPLGMDLVARARKAGLSDLDTHGLVSDTLNQVMKVSVRDHREPDVCLAGMVTVLMAIDERLRVTARASEADHPIVCV